MPKSKKKTDDTVTTPGRSSTSRPSRPAQVGDSVIASRAYDRYLARGREHGHDVDDWLESERELRASAMTG